MPNIHQVVIDGIRGINRTVDLPGKRILVTGPNGSGKSAIPVTIDFTLLGLVPGYQKKETFANASAEVMRGAVKIGEHMVERTLTQGKTLQERIAIDGGTPTDAKAAGAMLELILGQDPPVLNMPAFWEATSTEKRRILLKLVADQETQRKLAENENTARDAKNELTRKRQVAEKTVENLSKRLANAEKPAGNLDHIRQEIAALTAQIRETEKKVADGEANDRARAQMAEDAARLETATKALQNAEKAAKKPATALKKVEKALDALEAPTAPESGVQLPEQARKVIEQAVKDLRNIDSGLDEELADALDGVTGALNGLLPDANAIAAYDDAWTAYQEQKGALIQEKTLLEQELAKLREAYKDAQRAKEAAERAAERLKTLGAGLDPKDKVALDGMNSRRTELEGKVDPLAEIAMLGREIENARLEAEKALSEEDEAKKVLDEATKTQQAVVAEAAEELAKRSKAILPSGNLRLEDDGKDVKVYWAKSKDLRVERVSLSGGEQALFDCALGHTLAPTALIVIEGAEIDDEKIVEVMEHIPEGDFQVLLITCHKPKKTPKGWHHLDMAVK